MKNINKNLRVDPVTGCYIPVKSTSLFSGNPVTPLAVLPGGSLLLAFSGTTIYIIDRNDDNILLTYDTGDRILTAEICRHDLCTVYLESGQLPLCYQDEEWKPVPLKPFPEVKFRRGTVQEGMVATGERKLSTTYSLTSHTLNATDNAALTADLLECYTRVCQAADAARMFLQPVVVRSRYLDEYGHTLFVTPPVLVGPEDGFQCMSSVTSVIDSQEGTRGGASLSAQFYRLEVECPAALRWTVAKVLVEATPQLEIVNFNGQVTAAVVRGSDGRLTVRASLPSWPSTEEGRRLLVQSVLEHPELFTTLADISYPFDGKASTFSLGPDPDGTANLEAKVEKMRKILATPVDGIAENGVIGNGEVPHTVTCGTVARNGDTLLMGDLRVIPFPGYSLDSFACGFSDEKWKSAIMVEFAGDGGERVLRYCEGSDKSPCLLSPVISYPRADAVRMTVFYQSGGNCYSRSFNLTPSRRGDSAFYINPGLKPIDMKEVTSDFFIVPAENPVCHRYPRSVAAAHSVTPAAPYSFRHISRSPVTALTHALGSSAGWEYVRSRFYLFSPEGTFTVIVDGKRISGVNKVDGRGVSQKENVVGFTRRGVGVLTDSGDLLFWRGIAPVSAGKNLHGRLVFDMVHDELWLVSDDAILAGQASVSAPFHPGGAVERTFPDRVISVTHFPGGTVIRGERGLYSVGEETSGEQQVEIRFVRSFPMNMMIKGLTLRPRNKARRLRAVGLTMQSPGPVNLTVTVRADHGAGFDNSPVICRFKVRGAVNSPLMFHTPSPHAHTVHLTVEGQIPTDSSITDFKTFTEPYDE